MSMGTNMRGHTPTGVIASCFSDTNVKEDWVASIMVQILSDSRKGKNYPVCLIVSVAYKPVDAILL